MPRRYKIIERIIFLLKCYWVELQIALTAAVDSREARYKGADQQ